MASTGSAPFASGIDNGVLQATPHPDRATSGPGNTRLRLIVYNTFLLHIRVPTRRFGRDIMAAPAYQPRAHEIGETLAGRYDVVALMEVFDENEQAAVLEGWSTRNTDHALGPGPSLLRKSSGLMTVVDGPILARTAHHRYDQRGSFLHDAEVLANKGALMCEIDVGGTANLELYSTHLVAGNDFRRRAGEGHLPNPFRLRQVGELLAFVRRVHRPANVALVVGDFNVDAAATGSPAAEEHAAVRDEFGRDGFVDAWETHGTGAGYTACQVGEAAQICAQDPAGDHYCVEPAKGVPHVGAKRIDHVWLQRPDEAHRTAVAVEAIRRRSFPRATVEPDRCAMPFLSDHLALDLELALSPTAANPAFDAQPG
jgi:endonuclease/exonuclease/phosphatase family metal-dependent hydrolase